MDQPGVVGSEDDVVSFFVPFAEGRQKLIIIHRGRFAHTCRMGMTKEPNEQTSPADQTWEELARHVAGEYPPEESARIRQWLSEAPGRAELVEELDRSLSRLPKAADVDVEAALRRVKARRFEEQTRPMWRSNTARIAAAIAVVLGVSLVWRASNNRTPGPDVAGDYKAPHGQTQTIKLAGSTITLGPGSSLNVIDERTVDLAGDAMFEVVHDERHPFTVRAGQALIKDIGTRFVVKSNYREPVHVTVTEGEVELSDARGAGGVVLLIAGEHGTWNDGKVSKAVDPSPEEDLAWTQGRLVFDDASFVHVANELRRWYGVDLRVADEALTKRHITASFQGENVDQVLKVIGLAWGARIERNGNIATVTRQ